MFTDDFGGQGRTVGQLCACVSAGVSLFGSNVRAKLTFDLGLGILHAGSFWHRLTLKAKGQSSANV